MSRLARTAHPECRVIYPDEKQRSQNKDYPSSARNRALSLEDLEDLIDLRVAWEKRLSGTHFGENTADRPHVDSGGVLTTAQKDLGCTVPERDDLYAEVYEQCDGGRRKKGERARLSDPHTSCVYVRNGTPKARAKPKSANLRFPSRSIKRF